MQSWLPLALIAAWWFGSANSSSIYFPPLQVILSALARDLSTGPLMDYLAFSLTNLAAGLAIAAVAGIGIGILLGSVKPIRDACNPLIQFVRSIPQVALVPLIIGALGIGAMPKIWSIAFACMWPILLNTIDGVRGMDTAQSDMARAYRLTPRVRFWRVYLPAAMPQIMAGMRVALAVGVVVMVVSEIYGADSGIGYYILHSGRNFEIPETWAGTILAGLLGYVLSTLFVVIERYVLAWYFASAHLAADAN
jgi:ABC-type nitrate/sulfonate/bicarbonate transport system permease component